MSGISRRFADEWIAAAARKGDPTDALLAIASALVEQVTYCPLPSGYRAVFCRRDGSLVEEPIVALASYDGEEHRAVTCNGPEGFAERTPDWYLAPGESLADVETDVRQAVKRRRLAGR